MSRSRRFSSVLSLLLLAALALLALAATAAAETRTGEATSPINSEIPSEADLIGATAKYDSTTGEVAFTVTTRVRPEAEEEESPLEIGAALGVLTGATCALPEIGYPIMEVLAPYDESFAGWGAVEREGETATQLEPALKSVVGNTTTLVAASPKLTNKPYDCAVVSIFEFNGGVPKEFDEVNFRISVPPPAPPAPPTTPTTTTPSSSAPTTAPAVAPPRPPLDRQVEAPDGEGGQVEDAEGHGGEHRRHGGRADRDQGEGAGRGRAPVEDAEAAGAAAGPDLAGHPPGQADREGQ